MLRSLLSLSLNQLVNRIILDTGCAAGYLSDISKKSDDWLNALQDVSSDISETARSKI